MPSSNGVFDLLLVTEFSYSSMSSPCRDENYLSYDAANECPKGAYYWFGTESKTLHADNLMVPSGLVGTSFPLPALPSQMPESGTNRHQGVQNPDNRKADRKERGLAVIGDGWQIGAGHEHPSQQTQGRRHRR